MNVYMYTAHEDTYDLYFYSLRVQDKYGVISRSNRSCRPSYSLVASEIPNYRNRLKKLRRVQL